MRLSTAGRFTAALWESFESASEFHSERTKRKLETASVYLTDAILGTRVLSEVDVPAVP
jgi:hypothetical protein